MVRLEFGLLNKPIQSAKPNGLMFWTVVVSCSGAWPNIGCWSGERHLLIRESDLWENASWSLKAMSFNPHGNWCEGVAQLLINLFFEEFVRNSKENFFGTQSHRKIGKSTTEILSVSRTLEAQRIWNQFETIWNYVKLHKFDFQKLVNHWELWKFDFRETNQIDGKLTELNFFTISLKSKPKSPKLNQNANTGRQQLTCNPKKAKSLKALEKQRKEREVN